ncbi:MAG: helix-turn-helix domain-containing protein [Pseudonocardiales bacterium]
MGQRPKDLTPHESLHHYWGAELRALRVGRGLSLAELGNFLHCDSSYLAKIERAERPIPSELVPSCDQALQAQGALIRLHALAESDRDLTVRTADQPSAHLASGITHVANQTGNLTGGASLPAAPGTGEEIIVPARTSDGRVIVVAVPRRVFIQGLGSAAVGTATTFGTGISGTQPVTTFPAADDVHPIEHFQQMRQVLIDNDNLFGPHQVIPMVREQLAIMAQLRPNWRGADQRELIRTQAQYSELCGWLYQDAGEHHLAELWLDRALGLSHLATDHDLTVYILTCKAWLANDMRMATDAIGVGEHALSMASPSSRIAVIAASRAAYGYALNGDHAKTPWAYDRARELLDTLDDDPDSPYGPWLNEKWIDRSETQSWAVLGDYSRAAQSFQNAIADYPGGYRRGRGLCVARTALAHAGDHEVEHAVTLGLEALPIGVQTGSARILTTLSQLNDKLARWSTVPAVADFRTAWKDTIPHQT